MKLQIGDRVRVSARYREIFRRRKFNTGTVVGYATRSPDLVRIHPDGLRSASSFHVDFWDLVDSEPPVEGATVVPPPEPKCDPQQEGP